jgi:teichoic acid transport system permease protein
MWSTFVQMFKDLAVWRKQVWHLAYISLRRQTQNTVFGWAWLFLKPAMYIFCFWFALFLGMRASGGNMTGAEYLIWLASGIMPWFFLQDTINQGSHVFNQYAYLVNKLKFPVALIPVFHMLSLMFLHLLLMAVLFVMYVLCGGTFDVYFLQLPFIMVLMYVFSVGYSLMTSPLSAISKDVSNLIATLSTILFWLSGVIFDVNAIPYHAVQVALKFNPVTFIVQSYRNVFANGSVVSGVSGWIWQSPAFFWCGVGTIVATVFLGLFVFSRLRKEIPDVL